MTRSSIFAHATTLSAVLAFPAPGMLGCSSGADTSPAPPGIWPPDASVSNGGATSMGGFTGFGSGGDLPAGGDGTFLGDASRRGSDACGAVSIGFEHIPGTVLFVFDQSKSMEAMWQPNRPRWLVASDAVVAAVTPHQQDLNIGAIFMPTSEESPQSQPDNPCSIVDPIDTPPNIPFGPGTAFINQWVQHFTELGGKLILGTPWRKALTRADEAFAALPANGGKRIVVMLTDGAPTCEAAPGICGGCLDPVRSLLQKGIKTYVVGIPGSGTEINAQYYVPQLNDLAREGGTGSYIPADPAQLAATFDQLTTNAIDGCTFKLVPPPPDAGAVHLIGQKPGTSARFEIPMGVDGWQLAADASSATLQGQTCRDALGGGLSSIEFIYGCPEAVLH